MEIFLIRALQFIVAITILVFLHEGGHFLFSKLFGVRVNKFYVFFDYKFRLFSSYSNWWRKLRGKEPAKRREDGEYELCAYHLCPYSHGISARRRHDSRQAYDA